tara:strand:+ start:98 stop:340 length:243 start_codon:yes stop_codon:yes gene_type:complete
MESNIQSTTTVLAPKRYHRVDVVTKISDGSKHIVLRRDGKLTRDINGKWSLSKGDTWSEYDANTVAELEADLATQGYIEL